MNKEFVSLEIAKKLKRLGFTEPCFACYDNCGMLSTYSDIFNSKNYNRTETLMCSAPLHQQVINWLYNEYKLIVGVETVSLNEWKGFVCVSTMALEDVVEINETYPDEDRYKGMEQAINIALDIEILALF